LYTQPENPLTRPRSHAAARDAGTKLERDAAEYLTQSLGDEIVRRQRTGKDRGDLHGLHFHGHRLVVEAKNVAKMNLPAWIREAEVERGNDDALAGLVLHKRHGNGNPADQWVTMTLGELVALITLNRDHYKGGP